MLSYSHKKWIVTRTAGKAYRTHARNVGLLSDTIKGSLAEDATAFTAAGARNWGPVGSLARAGETLREVATFVNA